MTYKMSGPSLYPEFLKKKQSGMPMYGGVQKNPLKKALVGNQKNLPEELKAKIAAAPEENSPAAMYGKSPMEKYAPGQAAAIYAQKADDAKKKK